MKRYKISYKITFKYNYVYRNTKLFEGMNKKDVKERFLIAYHNAEPNEDGLMLRIKIESVTLVNE